MRPFESLGAFALHLLTLEAGIVLEQQKALHAIGEAVRDTAQEEIGNYQPAVGSFPAWAQLADSTEAEKARLGFRADAPLERTGELRDSISYQVEPEAVVIGSPSDIMLWQEQGTSTIPPRAALGPAAIRNKEVIERAVGTATVIGLLGGHAMPPGLGYDFKAKE